MSLLVTGATIIDGRGGKPLEGLAIWIEDGRIRAIAGCEELKRPPKARILDVTGKYIIPGLMNANVHLLADIYLETLARYAGRYEELIAEAAQVALRNGITTVFDTAGPRRFLTAVRDRINAGEVPGSRIFCAGWIVGLDGPYSEDFLRKVPEVASPSWVRRVNALWVENVGRHLMWLTPEEVATEVRTYIRRGIDFVKYASNDHAPGAFLAFSPRVQSLIVDEAHRAGITAQAHTLSVEGLHIAIQAGCDLIQHANLTGPTQIPEATLELFAKRGTGAVVFPLTERGFAWLEKNVSDQARTMWAVSDINARNLIRSDAALLLANDGAIFSPDTLADRSIGEFCAELSSERGGGLYSLTEGHFGWFRAMQEKGCPPMKMLQAATYNIARAYGKDRDLGTLESGKIADMLILDKNPLEDAENYKAISSVIKDGAIVDTKALPTAPMLTLPRAAAEAEEAHYRPFLRTLGSFPMCPACMQRWH